METSLLIYRANQLTGFYMMATLVFNESIKILLKLINNGLIRPKALYKSGDVNESKKLFE